MAHVVFLRGVNVGSARRFQPSALARELAHLGAANLGAAGELPPLGSVDGISLLGTADLWRVPTTWVGRPFREMIKALRRGPQGELPPPAGEGG